jgi:tetratricopeptide (TPR) repeat protein
VADNPRIEELRRRVQKDPASIAFAQLAEEYRRAGSHEDAIATCRAGLAIHPGYLSARVTLGRALIEVDELDAAQAELEYVLKSATENLAAIRGVAEIHHRRGELSEALGFYRTALTLAKHDPDLEQTVDEISRAISPAQAVSGDGLSFEQASAEFLAALEDLPGGLDAALAPAEPTGLPRLERFLDAIHNYRQKKAV